MSRRTQLQAIFLVLLLGIATVAFGAGGAKKKKPAVQPKTNAVVPSTKPSALLAPLRKPSTLDPNGAVEVRGQARTLSMMLVLKNGKDSINFIKVRKDYRPEILRTDF